MQNIIKEMEFLVIDWIRRYDLAGEYNKFWHNEEKPHPTGLSIIDFALLYSAEHKEEIE